MDFEDDYDYDGDEWDVYVPPTTLDKLIKELEWTLGMKDKFRTCPICDSPLICLEDNGSAQRFICGNAHLFSTNEQLLNN